MSTNSGTKDALWAVTISPAELNTRSAGTDVAGMHKRCFATEASYGNWIQFFFHQSNALLSMLI
ncbi:hypothetical protein DPMN_022056 [Dreissena polymorpha]|uniref:Uncharacterized protein n=1 Tax=Dreissena polymorpha TaxID=45954 RepID=A0A9D4NLV6_DREPO|nr:hypothetical protein DPMN_022056 [Dreissena polymorpha]